MRRGHVHIVLYLLVLFSGGCYREYSESGGGQRYTGTAPWTIEGVRPGQTLAEAVAILGPPKENPFPASDFRQWGYPHDVTITFDKEMRATDMVGIHIAAEGRDLVVKGQSEQDVTTVLGKGKARKHYRPKGSGVISIGFSYTGKEISYDNGNVTFEIGFSEKDTVNYVRATPLKKH